MFDVSTLGGRAWQRFLRLPVPSIPRMLTGQPAAMACRRLTVDKHLQATWHSAMPKNMSRMSRCRPGQCHRAHQAGKPEYSAKAHHSCTVCQPDVCTRPAVARAFWSIPAVPTSTILFIKAPVHQYPYSEVVFMQTFWSIDHLKNKFLPTRVAYCARLRRMHVTHLHLHCQDHQS